MKPSEFKELIEGDIVFIKGQFLTVCKNRGNKMLLVTTVSIDECHEISSSNAPKGSNQLPHDSNTIDTTKVDDAIQQHAEYDKGLSSLYPVESIAIKVEPMEILFRSYGDDLMPATTSRISKGINEGKVTANKDYSFLTKDIVDLLSLAGSQIELEPNLSHSRAFDYINTTIRKEGVTTFGTDLRGSTHPLSRIPHDAIYPKTDNVITVDIEPPKIIIPTKEEIDSAGVKCSKIILSTDIDKC